jgi:hypothetical protein
MGKIDRKRRSSVLLKGPLYHDLQPVAYNIARSFSTWSILTKKKHIPAPPTSRPRTGIKTAKARSSHHLVCAAPFFDRTDHPPKTLERKRNAESANHSATLKRLSKSNITSHARMATIASVERKSTSKSSLDGISRRFSPFLPITLPIDKYLSGMSRFFSHTTNAEKKIQTTPATKPQPTGRDGPQKPWRATCVPAPTYAQTEVQLWVLDAEETTCAES